MGFGLGRGHAGAGERQGKEDKAETIPTAKTIGEILKKYVNILLAHSQVLRKQP